jgi:hypothetical protein
MKKLAGEPGDRWLDHREMVGREESPDTAFGTDFRSKYDGEFRFIALSEDEFEM